MYFFLVAVHITACLFLILIVLMQAGRGAGLAVFGGGGDALFASPSGSTFMKKLTTVMAATFAVTSLLLTLLSGRVGMRSVTRGEMKLPAQPVQVPAGKHPSSAPPGPGSEK